jgi:hypothetical protein
LVNNFSFISFGSWMSRCLNIDTVLCGVTNSQQTEELVELPLSGAREMSGNYAVNAINARLKCHLINDSEKEQKKF